MMQVGEFKVRISGSACGTASDVKMVIEAESEKGFKGLIELITLKFPPMKVRYSKASKSVTLRAFDRIIGISESGKVYFEAESLDEARDILEYLQGMIDDARKDLERGVKPDSRVLDAWGKLQPLELYKYLPKTNCRECGEETCLAFAARVLTGERRLDECKPLSRPEGIPMISKLIETYGETAVKSLGFKMG